MAANPSTTTFDFDLGPLNGGQWHQYANDKGVLYYANVSTGAGKSQIPQGYEDVPNVSDYVQPRCSFSLEPGRWL